jgi:predicted ATP-dependent endonuclease of OLD family
MSQIVNLKIENVKRIKAVSITPTEGSVVLIKGRNAQGKSSVLDAIAYALAGKSMIPARPIRDGETSAKVELDVGEFIIRRKWSSNETSTLEIFGQNGAKYPSPQKLLDSLVGSLCFDPLAFSRMEKKKQFETLKQLVGLDTGDIDTKIKEIYNERTLQSRDASRLAAQVPEPIYDETPKTPIDIDALVQGERNKRNSTLDLNRVEYRDLKLKESTLDQQLKNVRARMVELEVSAKTIMTGCDATPEVAQARKINDIIKKKENWAAAKKAANEAKELVSDLTAQLEALNIEKSHKIQAIKYPVTGLSLGFDGVEYKGLPLSQASSAEQLRVSVAIGIAFNPKLKIMLIENGSLLDSDGLTTISEMAKASGTQVWIEYVSDSKDGVGIVIEDGEINHGSEEGTRGVSPKMQKIE